MSKNRGPMRRYDVVIDGFRTTIQLRDETAIQMGLRTRAVANETETPQSPKPAKKTAARSPSSRRKPVQTKG